MVFSSMPLYLDPHNWHQQHNQHHQGIGSSSGNTQAQILVSPPPPPPQPQLNNGGGGGLGSIRPGSMVDRARQAKLPQPEPGLNCPRCDSTNTKFCYFNNYNLTQPRHFCKTCRRYWTRGGALRNVPVGGGCRKNKRSTKNNNRASNTGNPTIKSTSTAPSNYSTEASATNFSQMPMLPSLDNLGNSLSSAPFGTSNLGLSFGAAAQRDQSDLLFIQLGSNNNNNNNNQNHSTIIPDQWRNSQHFPFITSFEPNTSSSSMYQLFQNDHQNVAESQSLMKMEDHQNQLGLNLRKPLLLGDPQNSNNHYTWSGMSGGNATWNDFSTPAGAGGNPNSSSPSHHLL